MMKVANYLLSLPERVVRAGAALTGGLIYETNNVLIPPGVRRSRLYSSTVDRLLRVTIELVGGVKGVYPVENISARELFVRKTAGNVVELASILAVGWSPLWLLAAAADLIGSTKMYLSTLVEELKRSGVLPKDSEVNSFDELLTTLEHTSGTLADAIDVPPLNVEDIRTSWESLQQNTSRLPDASSLATIFSALQEAARRENRSLIEVSSIVGLGAVRAGIQMGNIYLFDYYRDALQTIASVGLLVYLRHVTSVYVTRAAEHFSPQESTLTERWLSRWIQREQPATAQPATEPGRSDGTAEPSSAFETDKIKAIENV